MANKNNKNTDVYGDNMTINSIFGLRDAQILEPQYLDCKALNEMVDEWRGHVRAIITEIRALRRALGKSRDLVERYCLCAELNHKMHEMSGAVAIYRNANRDRYVVMGRYMAAAKEKAARHSRAA